MTNSQTATLIASITAIAAIVLGVVDSAQNRKHNRISVAPYLVIDYSLSVSGPTTEARIDLMNEGVGPAIVEPLAISVDGSAAARKDWSEVGELAKAKGFSISMSWNFRGGEAIGVQRGKTLLRMVGPSDRLSDLQDLIGRINVVITYKSIYGDSRTASLKARPNA